LGALTSLPVPHPTEKLKGELELEAGVPIDSGAPVERNLPQVIQNHLVASSNRAGAFDWQSQCTIGFLTKLAPFATVGLRTSFRAALTDLETLILREAADEDCISLQLAAGEAAAPQCNSLEEAIRAAYGTNDRLSDFRRAAVVVFRLLKACEFSLLLRFLADAAPWKRRWYFDDAPILDPADCLRIAHIAEDMECMPSVNEPNLEALPEVLKPISVDQLEVRVTGAVCRFTAQVNAALIQGEAQNDTLLSGLVGVVKLLTNALLTLSRGKLAPFDALLDIFAAIRKAEFGHPKFVEFVSALKEADATSKSDLKVFATLCTLLNRSLLPYLFLFVKTFNGVPKVPDPFYWSDISDAARLAGVFLPLRELPFEVDANDFARLYRE
jgi:hypothetical protein